jgi:hypothetical protein
MSRLYNQRQKDADEAHRIQVKAGFLVSRLWMVGSEESGSANWDRCAAARSSTSALGRVLPNGQHVALGLQRWDMSTLHSSGR